MSFIYKKRILFPDVDAAGILYYPRFLDFCHQTFEALFDQQGPISYAGLITQWHVGFPAVKIECEFLRPLSHGDMIDIHFCVKRIGNSSLTCGYQIYQQKEGSLSFKSEITTVLMDLNKHRSMPIAGNLREFLEQFL